MTIGILAHVDAGKTTLAEQILYRCGTLRRAGRVDRKDAFLDYTAVERERGITVFADQAVFEYGGQHFDLIDTPGHVDFSGEMERSIWVMDAAILVISSVEGIQSHTRTVWNLLRKHNIPTFLFLNKIDRTGAEPDQILREMRERFAADCIDLTAREEGDLFTPAAAETLAELDEELLERYLEKGYHSGLWAKTARRMFAACKFFPVIRGSALNGSGVEELLSVLALLMPEQPETMAQPFSARVYKVRHDKNGGRVVFLKVLSGTLHPKEEISLPSPDGMPRREKVNELRRCSGAKFTLIPEAKAGELCAVTGIQSLHPGDVCGAGAEKQLPFVLRPLLSAKVLFDPSVHPKTMLEYFRILEDEEPLLGVEWNEALQEIQVHIMGQIQLEILTEIVRERFGTEIGFGPCEILYQETVSAPVMGYGHFEPLRHYAEVHLRISPAERGSGIHFASECSKDDLGANWQNLIRTHVFEKQHKGVLTGSPLTDVTITLTAGRAHLKHTEGGDFREATYRAIRQGLMQARNVLLEPYYDFVIETEYQQTGRVLSDIQRMDGSCEPPETLGQLVQIRGKAPVSAMKDYPRELTALTKGEGRISLAFGGYYPCHNAEEVIARRAYDPERDTENTPDSVFCSHGAGYPVKWHEVPSHIHLK